MSRTVRLVPISKKGTKIFISKMNGDPTATVEDRAGDRIFLVARSGFCTWVNLRKDSNWRVLLTDDSEPESEPESEPKDED